MAPATALATAVARTFVLRGRASRAEFWILYAAIQALALSLGHVATRWPSTATVTLAATVSAATLVPLFTAGVRRAHDRGWDAWWLVGWMGTSAILVLMGMFVIMTTHSDDGQAESGFAIVLMGVAGVARVVIGLARKGDPGPNRYGYPP